MLKNPSVHEIHERHEQLQIQAVTESSIPWCVSPSSNLMVFSFVLFVPFVDKRFY